MTARDPAPARGLPKRLEPHQTQGRWPRWKLVTRKDFGGGAAMTWFAVSVDGTPSADAGALAAEIANRYNAHAGLVAFVERTLDACFCDDGRGLPECARCVGARAILAAVRGQP